MLRPEEKIGPYTLVRKLGKGAFKEVWLAEKRTRYLTTQVALGVMLDDSPEVVNALMQEAQVWVRAGGHPNVLPVLEVDDYDGLTVIVSEYAPDGTLQDWLNRHEGAAISVETALELTAGILAGLAHLHSRQPHPIIHRDLKFANVLLQGETPRIADFGISREQKTHIATTVAGTPVYMAPEIFDGNYSVQSDLWAVGVMLHRMLAGRLPFEGANMIQLARVIERNEPVPLPDTISSSLRLAIAHAMKKDPKQRYASAAEMRMALLEAGKAEPSPSRSGQFSPARVDNFFADRNRNQEDGLLEKETITAAEALAWRSPPQERIVPAQLSPIKINPIDGAEMVLIPAGAFLMGDDDRSNNPRRTSTLDAYYLYKTPVTVKQYRTFCEAKGLQMPKEPDWGWQDEHPMVNVSWGEAKAYCEWAGVNLPTEAQWEKAARGTDGRKFPWGNDWNSGRCHCSKYAGGDARNTSPVGSYPSGASPYGLLDMSGNVWEWCSDWYAGDYYKTAPLSNPPGPPASPESARVLRGGSWSYNVATYFRCSNRSRNFPSGRNSGLGFRCAILLDSR